MTLPPLTALIVEDTAEVADFIRRTMVVLGHECICVNNLEGARQALAAGAFHYALLDLKIPALPDLLFPDIQCGLTFLDEIGHQKGLGKTPIFVMTTHTNEGFKLAVELTQRGASRCIPKPLDDTSLAQIIKETLTEHAQKHPLGNMTPPPRQIKPFAGGSLAYFPDRIELNGQTIAENNNAGHAWGVLQILRRRYRTTGRAVDFKAAKLAQELGLSNNTDPRIKTVEDRSKENAIIQCVSDLRKKIIKVMLEIDIDCKKKDVIANENSRGYHLRDWITIEEHDKASAGTSTGTSAGTFAGTNVPANVPATPVGTPVAAATFADGDGPTSLNERQRWILQKLQGSDTLRRVEIENHFHVGEKTAKRDLTELAKQDLIVYIRTQKSGYYRLKRRG